MHTKTLLTLLSISTITLLFIANTNLELDSHLQKQSAGFQVTFESISSLLRAELQYIQYFNDTIYAGDSVGSLTVWSYDSKKKKLQFEDISRTVAPELPPVNFVNGIIATSEGAAVLTDDGKITAYLVNSTGKITGKNSVELADGLQEIKLIDNSNLQKVYFTGINKSRNKVCIYAFSNGLNKPNPVQQIACNSSLNNFKYYGLAYDNNNSLISVGDSTRAILFSFNLTETDKLKYLCEAFLPKVEVEGYEGIFAKSGTLIAINDLWVSSIVVDLSVPSAKVLSSIRTEQFVKTGLTNNLAVNKDADSKTTTVLINSKNRMQGYVLNTNQKLSSKDSSKLIGSPKHFILKDAQTLFATRGNLLSAVQVASSNDTDYFKISDSQAIASDNHFCPVTGFGFWNNTLVTTSNGCVNNFKLWNFDPASKKISFVDQKTFSYFSILQSGQVELPAIVMMPPPSKQNANATLHIAAAGNNPFNINIIPLTAQGKIGYVYESKGEHYANITSMFMTPDQKQLITSSLDTDLKVWSIASNRSQLADNVTTVSTKNGPINHGLQDKTGEYYVYAHTSTFDNKLVNISLWKRDAKKGATKIAQNTPNQAHYSNLTSLVLSHDEKYFISVSQSGQMRLQQHQDWTMVDLLASLSLGYSYPQVSTTPSNTVILQSEKQFVEYGIDFNGFVLIDRVAKKYSGLANGTLIEGNTLFSGDIDGSIRIYSFK